MHSVGALRFNLPKPVEAYSGILNATAFGNQCYNSLTVNSTPIPDWVNSEMVDYFTIFNNIATVPSDEDCKYKMWDTVHLV